MPYAKKRSASKGRKAGAKRRTPRPSYGPSMSKVMSIEHTGGVGDHGRIREMLKSRHNLTREEQALVFACLDPGHAIEACRDACPYPDNMMGHNVFKQPGQFDLDLTINGAQSVQISTCSNPAIACLVKYSSGATVYAYYWPHCAAAKPDCPGYFMEALKFNGVRCLGKSVTISNITEAQNIGGMCYSNNFELTQKIDSPVLIGSSLHTAIANNPVVVDWPATPAEFFGVGSYTTHDQRGCYLVGRPYSMECRKPENIQQNMSTVWGTTAIDATSRANTLWFNNATDQQGAPASLILNGSGGLPVPVPGLVDNMNTSMALFQCPSVAQTLHIKVHALFEFTMDPRSIYRQLGQKSTPNHDLCVEIENARQLLPQSYPESWNGGGKVLQWFKDRWNQVKGPLGRAAIVGLKAAGRTLLPGLFNMTK